MIMSATMASSIVSATMRSLLCTEVATITKTPNNADSVEDDEVMMTNGMASAAAGTAGRSMVTAADETRVSFASFDRLQSVS